MIQVEEYAGALVCWFLACLCLAAASLHAETRTRKIIGVIVSTLLFLAFAMWTILKKGEHPWSAFQRSAPAIEVYLSESKRWPTHKVDFTNIAELQRAMAGLTKQLKGSNPVVARIKPGEETVIVNVIIRNVGKVAAKSVNVTIGSTLPFSAKTYGAQVFSNTEVHYDVPIMEPAAIDGEEYFFSLETPTPTRTTKFGLWITLRAENLPYRSVFVGVIQFERDIPLKSSADMPPRQTTSKMPSVFPGRSHIHIIAVDLLNAASGGVLECRVHFENNGDFPIAQLRPYVVMAIMPYANSIREQMQVEDALFTGAANVSRILPIIPNQVPAHSIPLISDQHGETVLTSASLAKVESGSSAIYLVGEIVYKDSVLHHSDFCYFTKGDVRGMKLCHSHNEEP